MSGRGKPRLGRFVAMRVGSAKAAASRRTPRKWVAKAGLASRASDVRRYGLRRIFPRVEPGTTPRRRLGLLAGARLRPCLRVWWCRRIPRLCGEFAEEAAHDFAAARFGEQIARNERRRGGRWCRWSWRHVLHQRGAKFCRGRRGPSASVTKQMMASPLISSGRATTAASATEDG